MASNEVILTGLHRAAQISNTLSNQRLRAMYQRYSVVVKSKLLPSTYLDIHLSARDTRGQTHALKPTPPHVLCNVIHGLSLPHTHAHHST